MQTHIYEPMHTLQWTLYKYMLNQEKGRVLNGEWGREY